MIFSSSDEKFTVRFFYGRYDFWLPHQHLIFGDTHSLLIPDTWTHVAIQVGLDCHGMFVRRYACVCMCVWMYVCVGVL